MVLDEAEPSSDPRTASSSIPSVRRASSPLPQSGSPSSSFIAPAPANGAGGSTNALYKRSSQITNVNRIGRARSILRVEVSVGEGRGPL